MRDICSRAWRGIVLAGSLVCASLALPQAAIAETPVAALQSITVTARSITAFDRRDPSRSRFGSLEFLGGLVLTSSFPSFGGLSGLRLDQTGEHFTSFSDKGDWFTGRLVYRGPVLTGVADVATAPMLGPDGRPLARRGWFDTESLTFDGSVAYVGIERVNQIVRFDSFGRDGVRALGKPIDVPAQVHTLPFNKGLESLVFVPRDRPLGGTLIAISERGLDPAGNLLAFLIGGPSPGTFTIRRSDRFDISDATLLGSDALLILERKFSLLEGLGIRIRRIPLTSIVSGQLVDGPVIFEADLGNEVDNMEGLDVHRTAEGDTVLTMISDDNFSPLQRTLLLQFRLIEP